MTEISSHPKHRNLIVMLLLTLVTCGFYYLYWTYKTKEEINNLGGRIPTFLFAIIPFFNIYFHYCYAREFVTYILRQEDQGLIIAYWLLLLLLPVISMFAVQYSLNQHQK